MATPAATAKTPTSATRADARRAAALPPGRRRPRGFTLIELLVTLSLAGLLVALVPTALGPLRESMQYRDTVRAVLSDVRVARQRALAEGVEVRFAVDLAQRRFGVEGRPPRDLPEALQMRVVVAGIEWSPSQVGAIRFLPQGGATGGTVEVVRPSGAGTRITVDWLSGAVSQSPVVPAS